MKIEKKIESWCKDECFMDFVHRRMHQELTEKPENGRYDDLFEELDEAFDYDDRYIEPLVEYLTFRLHIAKLCKNTRKRGQGIWWVWFQVMMEGHYVRAYSEYFDPLLAELQTTLMPMLHKEYVRMNTLKEK